MGKRYEVNGTAWTYQEPSVSYNGRRGPCPICGTVTHGYGGGWKCSSRYCVCSDGGGSVRNEPKWWNTDVNIGKDGNQFTAYRDDFIDLQESNCGFGDTPDGAFIGLLRDER